MIRRLPLLLLLACAGPATAPPPASTPTEVPRATVTEPVAVEHANACAPATWCDQAAALGLHDDEPLYGRGAAWVDVDGDGWEDLWLSHDRFRLAGWNRVSTLYRNLEGQGFEAWDLGIAPGHTTGNWAGVWGDYDNDGDPDLFLANGGYSGAHIDRLYRNDLATEGHFTEVTQLAGFDLTERMSWAGAWADVDRDGWIDLVVTHRSRAQDAPCCEEGSGDRDAAEYSPVLLYLNQGDGTFRERGADMGLADLLLDGKNPVWLDIDRDGWLDLFLANAGSSTFAAARDAYRPGFAGKAFLYRNVDGTRFEDVSTTAIDDPGLLEPVFAATALDFNQDGWDDLYLGRAFEADAVLLNQRDGTFASQGAGLDLALGFDGQENTMGLGAGDLTGDGFPEVYIGTGWPDFQGLPILFSHAGTEPRFQRVPSTDIGGIRAEANHGAAFADFDHDGDVDMAWNLGGFGLWDVATDVDHRAQPALLLNHATTPYHTVAVRLEGTRSNRDALGARMAIHGSETRHHALLGTSGFQSWNGPWTTLSLGTATEGTLEVTWPDGTSETVDVRAGTRLHLRQAE